MAASREEARYYIDVDGSQDGPFRLGELASAGVERDTPLWVPGRTDWLPAHELPEVAALLEEQWRRQRSGARKARRLPDPDVFRKLRLAILCVDEVAALFFITGSTALLTALVLMFTFESAARLTLLVGLVPAILGIVLLILEAALVGVFLWNCFRIVKVLAPRRDTGTTFSWRDWVHEQLNELPSVDHGAHPNDVKMAGVAVLASLLFCLVFGPLLLVFLVPYGPFAYAIYRLGYGLDRVRDRYHLRDADVPPAPIGLGFFTALTGILLLAGPLSIVFFILLPLWASRTARVAESICRTDPARLVKDKPILLAPSGPAPSPLDVS